MKSPLDEIFKSLGSLKEELNEQNKVNVKQKNLEKVKQFILERKEFLDEDFKSQEQNYINQGNEPQIVKSYIERFRKIKDKNYRQLNDQIDGLENVRDRKNIDSYKSFKELETIVDYVGGQIDLAGTSLGNDIEIDAKPIYEDDIFQIYYADSPRACIKYKGNIPYGWCVSQREGNMYYTYRYKQNEPAFYFVKVKDRTKKELGFFSMVGNVFNGQFKDKYHFFVLQTLKGAEIGDTTTNQYVVTSAMNDGDKQMSWNDVVTIEPRIGNLQEIFKPVGLSPEDKEFYERFKDGTDNTTFCKLDYTSKRRYLDIYVTQEQLLSDVQFKCLPEDLMNLYIGFGVGLYENEFELIKSNKNLLKRYQQITEKKLEEYLKGTKGISFKYTELLILPEDKRQQIIMKLDLYDFYMILTKSSNPQGLINILGEKGKELILELSEHNIYDILEGKSKETINEFINTLFNVGGKEFITKLDDDTITYFLTKSLNPQGIMDILGERGKQFITRLYPEDIFQLLSTTQENRDKIISILFNVGGKEFITKLNNDVIANLLTKSLNPQGIMDILGEKGKQFITRLNDDDIYFILRYKSQENRNEIINTLFNVGGKEFIVNLDSRSCHDLLYYSSERDKIINILLNVGGKEFIMNLNNIDYNLLQFSSNPEQIKQILQKYGKLPKEEMNENLNKNNMKTPLDELFNSFNNLKKELNEQNKENIKRKNLEKVKQFLLEKFDAEGIYSSVEATAKALSYIMDDFDTSVGKNFNDESRIALISSHQKMRHARNRLIKKLGFDIGNLPSHTPSQKNTSRAIQDISSEMGYMGGYKTLEEISEVYHTAKNDGSNPDLVKAVENLLGKPSLTSLQEKLTEQNKVNNFIKKKMLNEIGFDTPELAAQYDIQRLKGDITSRGSSQPDKYLTNAIDLKNTLENIIPSLKTAEPNISNASENKFAPKEMGNKEFLSYSFTKNVDENRGTYFIEKVFIYPIDGKVFDFITKSYVLENDVIARVKLGDFKQKLTIQQLNSALWKWLREYQNVPIAPSLNETKQRNLMKVKNYIKNRNNNH
jgi:hypothetical protein